MAGPPVYATVDDLIVYTGDPASVEVSPRFLVRASRQVDTALGIVRYAVDADEQPTDPEVVAALRDATCAQARALIADGTLTVLVGEAEDCLADLLHPARVYLTG